MDKNNNFCVACSSAGLPATELRIEIDPMDLCFEGTRAELEAEGLIPDGFEWPEGRECTYWQSNVQSFELMRHRPPGHRGTQRTWLECDWWFVRVRLLDGPGWKEIQIRQKKAEIAELEWKFSAAGERAIKAMYSRLDAAGADRDFQAFKARLPGLSNKRKGKHARTVAES